MATKKDIIISAQSLTRRFGEITAVSQLNLEIAKGEIFGLVGPDGAGKTTTLRLLCGLLDPTEGKASVTGQDISQDAEVLRDHIGYMAQRFGLYGDLTVQENILFYSDLFSISDSELKRALPELLKMTRMEPFRKRQARKLSGGMKQKLALICTLLHRPQILLLDEPTNGVDPVSRRDFWAILYQLVKEGLTVLITTSYMDEAERCNRVGMIYKGNIIHCDTPEAIKNSLKEKCYELQCRDLRTAREGLLKMPGILTAEPCGSVLHLFLIPNRTSADDIKESLIQKGLSDVSIKSIEPSLEDVFIAMIRKASI